MGADLVGEPHLVASQRYGGLDNRRARRAPDVRLPQLAVAVVLIDRQLRHALHVIEGDVVAAFDGLDELLGFEADRFYVVEAQPEAIGIDQG